MNFKEVYTTAAIKEAIFNGKDKTAEEKEKENKKTEVTNEAYLLAEMINSLINKLEQARISGLMKR